MDRPLIECVEVQNYKNIKAARVQLSPLTVLVGPNGAGKSNFVDALMFASASLTSSIDLALRDRGGIAAVRRRSSGRPTHFGMRLSVRLDHETWAEYAFRIRAEAGHRFSVDRESCVIRTLGSPSVSFEAIRGEFKSPPEGIRPRLQPDRLALQLVAAIPEFTPIYDFLTNIRRYNVRPQSLRELQNPDPMEGLELREDGSNAAAVLRRLRESGNGGAAYERICRLLSQVVPGTQAVEPKSLGQQETLQFRQMVDVSDPWRFDALSMSDGTLRVLGILLAVYQPRAATLVAIEEPEATIHPAAAEVLMDILFDGSTRSQVLITTHSPDILDNAKLAPGAIVAVESERGVAQLTPVTPAVLGLIRDRLYTPGELLRQGEIRVDKDVAGEASRQLDLFPS